jgi:hypothetical protein
MKQNPRPEGELAGMENCALCLGEGRSRCSRTRMDSRCRSIKSRAED